MKEIVFYKNEHYLTLQKCTDRRKRPIQKTFREEAERQTEKEKASNLIDIIFLKSQNQFDISIVNYPDLHRSVEVGASCFNDPGYYHTTWQFSQNLYKR